MKVRDLKEIDKKILRELIHNSKLNHTEIAEKIETTRQTVSERISKLHKKKKKKKNKENKESENNEEKDDKNIIKSFTITINTHLFDELKVKAHIFFREEPSIEMRQKNEEIITNLPQVTYFSRLYGKYAGIIEILVKDNEEANEFLKQLHSLKGIIETETYFVREVIKDKIHSPFLKLISQ